MTDSIEQVKKRAIPKTVRIAIIVVVILALAGVGIRWYIQLSTTVKTDNAKISADLVSISAEVSGRLTEVLLNEGDSVEQGQELATLDDTQYRISLAQAEAAWELSKINVLKLPKDLETARTAVSKAESALVAANAQANIKQLAMEDSKRAFDNYTALYQQGAISKDTLDNANSKYLAALQDLDTANANVYAAQDAVTAAQTDLNTLNQTGEGSYDAQEKQAKSAYDNAQLALSRTSIQSPISGNVIKVAALTGQNVSAGTSLFTIVNPEQVWVMANIEEKKVGRILVGDAVSVVVDAYPHTVFSGEVVEIGGATQSSFSILPTENTSGNYTKVAQRFPVKISVVQQEGKLKPGMSAVVTIKTKRG
ncbi:MAG: HlyD family secretion protein [Peptococcaceae bacterium]|jgi:membrane fusion protein (multidrug efflux system)|nr:HlyD family secretion protein [Peptococcaceae bacterium]